MALLFARHGNTFEAGETARIVGAHEDMPLTEAGKEQARVLGRALKDADVKLDAIVSGPLSRTKVFAEIAAELAGFQGQIRIDPRLRELDFGDWSGLSDDEVAQLFGQAALDNWRKHGVPHAPAKWAPSETEIRANISTLATELNAPESGNNHAALCVTSNGILRYVLELDPRAFVERGQNGGFRVKTGRLCAFRRSARGLKLAFWDEIPQAERLSELKV